MIVTEISNDIEDVLKKSCFYATNPQVWKRGSTIKQNKTKELLIALYGLTGS